MIDLASIRNASFTLTPTGYNPEEVDRFLPDLADQLAESLSAPAATQYESNPHFDVEPQPEPQYAVESATQREPAEDHVGLLGRTVQQLHPGATVRQLCGG